MALTAHYDASDTGNLFTTFDSGGSHSGTPSDGNEVQAWDNEAGISDQVMTFHDAASESATFRSGGSALMKAGLTELQIEADEDYYTFWNQTGSSEKLATAYLGTTSWTLLAAIYPTNISATDPQPYENHALWAVSPGGNWGCFLRDNSGPKILTYGFDSADRVAELSIAINEVSIVAARYTGSQVAITVVDSAGNRTDAATNCTTPDLSTGTQRLHMGASVFPFPNYHGRIGEFKIWDSGDADGTLDDEIESFKTKWLDIASGDAPIWEFDELTSPALADLLAIVDDPSGTPITKKLALTHFSTLTASNVVVQVKTAGSGTYTPTAGMKKVLAIGVGGGGAGAGGINTDSAGGGGGGGGTVIRLMTAADIGASKAYVVGAAGAATTLDAAGALLNAGAGANGTAGATFSVIGVSVAGGAGGTATNGDLNIPGQPGERGIIYSGADGRGGKGGRTVFGAGGIPGGTNVAGGNGGDYGGGGAGGHASATADRAGGSGAAGILYLIEFLG